MAMTDNDGWLTTSEASERTGRTAEAIRKRLQRLGNSPQIKRADDNTLLVHTDLVDSWAERNEPGDVVPRTEHDKALSKIAELTQRLQDQEQTHAMSEFSHLRSQLEAMQAKLERAENEREALALTVETLAGTFKRTNND